MLQINNKWHTGLPNSRCLKLLLFYNPFHLTPSSVGSIEDHVPRYHVSWEKLQSMAKIQRRLLINGLSHFHKIHQCVRQTDVSIATVYTALCTYFTE